MNLQVLLFLAALWTAIIVVGYFVTRPLWIKSRSARLFLFQADEKRATRKPKAGESDDEPRYLQRWLFLAGYRSAAAPWIFVIATIMLLVMGLSLAFLVQRSGVLYRSLEVLSMIPGNIVDVIAPLIFALPWALIVICTCIPWLIVRAARRNRVGKIEQDLPVVMELLATLCEAGLGYDAAVERIIDSLGRARPLVSEFRTYRIEALSGRSRVQCFRRLGRRVEVSSFSVFVSAVVQAEQVGAGVATVLRRQADDVRDRRRERAMEFVMSRPVKLLFPMVVGFLPGIFLWSLGPTFFELLSFFDTFTVSKGF